VAGGSWRGLHPVRGEARHLHADGALRPHDPRGARADGVGGAGRRLEDQARLARLEREVGGEDPFRVREGRARRARAGSEDEGLPRRRLPARRATGQTWTQIADWLQDEGVPKRYSTASWKQTDVAKLAANDVYLGIATNGDVRNENAHKALVSPELWYAVKGIRDNHRSKNAHSKIDAPLGGGYVRCSSCGVGLTRTTSTERDGKKYGFYICRNPECRKSSISAAALEPYVYEVIAKTAVLKVEEPYEADAARDAARQAVETAQAAIQGFDATWADQGLDPVAAISMRKALEVRLDEARKRLADLPVDVVDWRTQVRKTYEEWSQTLGIEFDPEDDVRVIEKQFTEGVTGAWLYELLADGGETAREVVRQNLKRVVVTGKSATPGKPESRKSVEARVEVEVIP